MPRLLPPSSCSSYVSSTRRTILAGLKSNANMFQPLKICLYFTCESRTFYNFIHIKGRYPKKKQDEKIKKAYINMLYHSHIFIVQQVKINKIFPSSLLFGSEMRITYSWCIIHLDKELGLILKLNKYSTLRTGIISS
jgi:hypothetical protein